MSTNNKVNLNLEDNKLQALNTQTTSFKIPMQSEIDMLEAYKSIHKICNGNATDKAYATAAKGVAIAKDLDADFTDTLRGEYTCLGHLEKAQKQGICLEMWFKNTIASDDTELLWFMDIVENRLIAKRANYWNTFFNAKMTRHSTH